MNQLTVAFTPQAGSLEQYLGTVNSIPILTAQEEFALARQLRDEQRRLAAERLVLSHLRLVVSIARRYMGYGLPLADLIQEGTVGLLRAVRRFDPELGIRLAAFAAYHIRCEVSEFVLRNWRLVRVATTKAQRKLFFNLKRMRSRLGWMSTDEIHDIATFLQVSSDDVREMQGRLLGHDVSLSGPASRVANDATTGSFCWEIPDDAATPEDLAAAEERRAKLAACLEPALDVLDARSRDIITRRWLGEEQITLEALGNLYGITKERVRQIESKAFEFLRRELLDLI